LIASVDKAKEMGINWWEGDPFLKTSEFKKIAQENEELRKRLARLEHKG
jgi:cell shape-determining protein MreC